MGTTKDSTTEGLKHFYLGAKKPGKQYIRTVRSEALILRIAVPNISHESILLYKNSKKKNKR